MPKEFGDWLGEQPPLNFDDPGNWKALPKKKVEPEPALVQMTNFGFKYNLKNNEWNRMCVHCGNRGLFIRALVAQEYLDYCLKNRLDPRVCSFCQPS